MTKEKPIGLIVGLFFIIVFGLILSELTGAGSTIPTAPPAAEQDVNAHFRTPQIDEDRVPYVPALATTASTEGQSPGGESFVSARMPRADINDREGTIEVEFGPEMAVLAATQMSRESAVDRRVDQMTPRRESESQADRRAIYVAPGGVSHRHVVGPAAAAEAQTRSHVVEAGDTLTGIARKFYGPGKQREYKRIFAANRGTMRTDSDLSIGQVLVIPPLESDGVARRTGLSRGATTPAGGRTGERYRTVSLAELPGALSRTSRPPAPAGSRTYTIKSGDTLTGIARRMMRDGSREAVRKLFEANRGVLESRNMLKVGTELRLPY